MLDVADFMGYRNIIKSTATPAGGKVRVSVGGAQIDATPIEPVTGGKAVVAIRPDELKVDPNGPITVTVDSAQYHGHDFYCSGKTPDGTELYFRSPVRAKRGDTLRLTVDPTRALVYGDSGQ